MNPITNSPVKEKMRLANESEAKNKETQINSRLQADIAALQIKPYFSGGVCVVLMIAFAIIGVATGGGFTGFIVGGVLGAGAYGLMNLYRKNQNKEVENQKHQLEQRAQQQIRDVYNEADRKTQMQIDRYDKDVQQYCKTILKKADTISPMVERTTTMFQRMVSHADASSNIRFVEADFTYTVNKFGITYSYQSRYTNPQDDFNFDKERFRNLTLDTECEGLAQAIAKLTVKKMMGLYPPNSLHITLSHIDAAVTLHFKAANKNFVAAVDIF